MAFGSLSVVLNQLNDPFMIGADAYEPFSDVTKDNSESMKMLFSPANQLVECSYRYRYFSSLTLPVRLFQFRVYSFRNRNL